MIAPVTLVVADDRPMTHRYFTYLVASLPSVQLLATVSTLPALVQALQQHQPTVVVTDLKLGDATGPQITAAISEHCPRAAIVVFTEIHTRLQVEDMLDAGIRAYLLHTEKCEKVQTVITEAALGQEYFNLAVVPFLQGHRKGKTLRKLLTKKEMRILQLTCQSLSQKMIADEVMLQLNTVEQYCCNIRKRLDILPGGIQQFCIENGIVGVRW